MLYISRLESPEKKTHIGLIHVQYAAVRTGWKIRHRNDRLLNHESLYFIAKHGLL